MKIFVGVYLFIFIIIGCKKKIVVEQQLATVGNLSLDSSYNFLKSIRIQDISRPKAKADYALLYTEVCFKKMLPVTSDSLIDIALNYYQTQEEPAKLAKAYYYKGKILGTSDSIQKATQFLLKAEQYALEANEERILGLLYSALGSLYIKQFLPDKALTYFRKARQKFILTKDSLNAIYSLGYIARSFLNLHQTDSSLYYFLQAKSEAIQQNDNECIIYINRCLIPFYLDKQEIEKAKALVLDTYRENQDKFLYRYGLADCFIKEGKYDSAKYYLNQIIEDTSLNLSPKRRLAVFYQIREVVVNLENYRNAYDISLVCESLADSIFKTLQDANILKVEQKYRNEQLLNQNYLLQLKTTQQTTLLLIFFFLIVIIVFIAILINKHRKRILEQSRQQQNEYLAFIESLNQKQISSQNDLMNQLNESIEKEKQLKKVLTKRLEIIKQLSDILYQYGGSDEEKPSTLFSQKVKNLMDVNTLTQDTLSDLLEIVNENYFGIITFLKTNYSLSRNDLILCSFISSGFTPQEISILYNISVDNVYIRCSRLGKKMGLKVSLTTYIKETLVNLKLNRL